MCIYVCLGMACLCKLKQLLWCSAKQLLSRVASLSCLYEPDEGHMQVPSMLKRIASLQHLYSTGSNSAGHVTVLACLK